jgi:HEAT repeat protein/TolA-binding protein
MIAAGLIGTWAGTGAAQVTPPPARAPQPAPAPRATRAPVALPPIEQPAPRDFELFQRDVELRNFELLERSAERQRELEDRTRERQLEIESLQRDRQRELDDRMVERQRELEERQRELAERQRDRSFERGWELMSPATPMAAPLPALPSVQPTPAIAPRAFDEKGWVSRDLDGDFLNRRPREAWSQGDPADSIYRVAREALNRGEYRRAAQTFNELTRRFPNSAYAYVSGYWEAYSRYRIGTTDELKLADRVLQNLGSRSALSGTRDDTDVNGLWTRIRGALAVRGDVGSSEMIEEKARGAGTSCDREDLLVRVEALNALSQMDAAAAMPILRRVLDRKDECLVELRRRAVFMLARRGDKEATNLLITAATNDPNIEVRVNAIEYLPRMPGDAPLDALEDILRTSDDERVQRAAVRALVSSDNPDARAIFRTLIERKDASETMRMQAIDAMNKERATPEDAAYLRALYSRVENDRLKSAIISALARIGGRENQAWLTNIVRNTNETSQIRTTALDRLSRSPDLTIADLGRMYEAADSRSMRERIINALANRKEPEATDKLIEIARGGTDPEMRRMAINHLSRKNDPRTTKLLMELIEK